MRVAHELSAWGVQAYFAAVTSHPATFRLSAFCFPRSVLLARAVIVVDAVVVLAQHRQIRRLRMASVLVGVDVVHLASIGGHVAVWPRTDEILRHG